MPLYDYRCAKGHSFEEMQSFTDEPTADCPECGSQSERVLHPPAIRFKGSGFHNTDYGVARGRP